MIGNGLSTPSENITEFESQLLLGKQNRVPHLNVHDNPVLRI